MLSDQRGGSSVRPEPVIIPARVVSSLMRLALLFCSEQIDAAVAGEFSDIRQQGTSEPPNLPKNASYE
jgi:hypothetical protein